MSDNLSIKLQKVALYLGHPWKYNHLRESNWSYEIIDGSGRVLYFRIDGTMFRVSGLFPRDKTRLYDNRDYKTIGVSISRPAKDIAADIARRLLPHYLKAYDKAVEHHQKEQAQAATLDYMVQALRRVSGGRIAGNGRSAKTVYFDNGKAELWTGEHITLELNRLHIDKAIQVIGVLRQEESG